MEPPKRIAPSQLRDLVQQVAADIRGDFLIESSYCLHRQLLDLLAKRDGRIWFECISRQELLIHRTADEMVFLLNERLTSLLARTATEEGVAGCTEPLADIVQAMNALHQKMAERAQEAAPQHWRIEVEGPEYDCSPLRTPASYLVLTSWPQVKDHRQLFRVFPGGSGVVEQFPSIPGQEPIAPGKTNLTTILRLCEERFEELLPQAVAHCHAVMASDKWPKVSRVLDLEAIACAVDQGNEEGS